MNLIIIGEPDSGRYELVENAIKPEYDVETAQAHTAADVHAKLKLRNGSESLVLLTDNFAQGVPLASRFSEVWIDGQMTLGYLHGHPPQDVSWALHRPELILPFPANPPMAQRLLEGLDSRLFYDRVRVGTLDKDILLHGQLRSLAHDQDLDGGLRLLRFLVLGFFLDDFHVYRLRSGLSGATVFKIVLTDPTGIRGTPPPIREYIIKIGREPWKLRLEAEKHVRVASSFPPGRASTPQIQKPRANSRHDGDVVVGRGGLHAICFTFLGGQAFGASWDLQAILTSRPERLPPHSQLEGFRKSQLSLLADWLKKTWGTAAAHARRFQTRAWDPQALELLHCYPVLPPYSLPSKSKLWILEFLDSAEAEMGYRLFGAGWKATTDRVRRFVTWTEPKFGVDLLDEELPIVHSPAHGDLNANNVLFFPQFPDPVFVIDFPMYQVAGHALQDFARLEAEIKYALMDKQENTPNDALPGFDYDPAQVLLWCELEDKLREAWEADVSWTAKGYSTNVQLTFELIRALRLAAREVQQNPLNVPPALQFELEYLLPLLYHTLRAITYPSLSPFKRILAIYSSAHLLMQAGFL